LIAWIIEIGRRHPRATAFTFLFLVFGLGPPVVRSGVILTAGFAVLVSSSFLA